MRSRSIELRKAGRTLHVIISRMVAQSLILTLNGIGVGKEDHTIKLGVQHQILILLVNIVGVRKKSHIQGIEQDGVELLMPIHPVTAKRVRENVRKGVTGLSHQALILVIMDTRKNIHLVVEDHLIKTEKTEVESILDTTGIEEKTLHKFMNKVTGIYGWKGFRIHNSFSRSSEFGENVGLIPKWIFLLLLVGVTQNY